MSTYDVNVRWFERFFAAYPEVEGMGNELWPGNPRIDLTQAIFLDKYRDGAKWNTAKAYHDKMREFEQREGKTLAALVCDDDSNRLIAEALAKRTTPAFASEKAKTMSTAPLTPRTVDLLTEAAMKELDSMEGREPAPKPDGEDLVAEARAEAEDYQRRQLQARGFTVNAPAVPSAPGKMTGERTAELLAAGRRSDVAIDQAELDAARAEAAEYQKRQLQARGIQPAAV